MKGYRGGGYIQLIAALQDAYFRVTTFDFGAKICSGVDCERL